MKPRRIRDFKIVDRIRAKNEAKSLLRDVKKISRRILSLETISDIRDGIDRLETSYRRAVHNSLGDEKLYTYIRNDAISRFSIIADYVREISGLEKY